MEDIDSELDWRDKEIALAKADFLRSDKGSEKRELQGKVLVLVGYSHYEGFIKFLWDYYIDHLERLNAKVSEFSAPFRALVLRNYFGAMKNNWSVHQFVKMLSSNEPMLILANSIEPLKTNSNLWPNLLKSNNLYLDIDLPCLSYTEEKIKQLVSLRNSAAHGQKLQLTNIEDTLSLVEAARSAMYEMALKVDDSISKRKYSTSQNNPQQPQTPAPT